MSEEKLIEQHQNNLLDINYNEIEIRNKRYQTIHEKLNMLREQSSLENNSEIQDFKIPLSQEQLNTFAEVCRNIRGYKLDDFPPGSCKRGVRRESKVFVLGPFDIEGYKFFHISPKPEDCFSYAHIEIKNGRYKSDSTHEGATACVGRGEIPGSPEGSWSLTVRKAIGTEEIRTYSIQKDHNDDFGRHATIAASDMCEQMIAYIINNLFV